MTVVIDRVSGGGGGESPPPGGGHGPGLYQKRKAIYPKLVHGSFRRLKWGLMVVMLAIYYGTPWIRWPRPAGVPSKPGGCSTPASTPWRSARRKMQPARLPPRRSPPAR